MNERDEQELARDTLRERVEAIVGSGPIARFEEALTHTSFANETPGPNKPAARVPRRRGARPVRE